MEIFDEEVIATLLTNETGVSGVVYIEPPEPGADSTDKPLTFAADILAKTVLPQSRLNGCALRVAIGLLQILFEITVADVPSHAHSIELYVLSSLNLN